MCIPSTHLSLLQALGVGAVYKAAERIKRMVIQECRDGAAPNPPG